MNNDEIMVSICCITYNHAKYIAEAIDSFLMQKLDYKYEILIHDDASTDGTVKIIKEYEKRFPNIIKPIYQKENQYSKGNIRINYEYNIKRAKGKYIALCEGDDYWTDPYKLQKQINYMEKHQQCSLCVHSTYIKYICKKKKSSRNYIKPSSHNRKFFIVDILKSDGGIFSTNSILYRREYNKTMPKFYFIAPVGDYPLIVYLATKGYIYYMNDVMSVYRKGVENSWSERILRKDKLYNNHLRKKIYMFDEINKYLNYRFNNILGKKLLLNNFNYNLYRYNYKQLSKDKYKMIIKNLPIRTKVHIKIGKQFPRVMRFIMYLIINLKKNYYIKRLFSKFR